MTTKHFIKQNSYKILFLGFSAVIVSFFFSFMLFRNEADMAIVLFTTLALSPFIYLTLKIEEDFDIHHRKEQKMIFHHLSVFKLYLLLFLGGLIAFLVLFMFLPDSFLTQAFASQMNLISSTAQFTSLGSQILSLFLNNSKILVLCIFLSFFYGVGAIFILMWNASVIATAIGTFFHEMIAQSNVFFVVTLTFLRFALHGIPEILAYFVGGLAGGIISVAVIRHHYRSKKFYAVLKDAAYLVIFSFVLLGVAAFIEAIVLMW